MPSLIITSLKALSPNTIILVVRASTHEFGGGGDIIQSITPPYSSQTPIGTTPPSPTPTVVSAGPSEELIFIPSFSPVGADSMPRFLCWVVLVEPNRELIFPTLLMETGGIGTLTGGIGGSNRGMIFHSFSGESYSAPKPARGSVHVL